LEDANSSFTGHDGAKRQFTVTAVRAARRKAIMVLAAHPNLGLVAQAMRMAAPRMKSIVCAHGVDVWEPLGVLRRWALQHSNLILAPSKDTAEHVAAEQDVPQERIRVLPWALDPQFEGLISPGSHPALPANFPTGRVILSVGRWLATERYKGMDTLITALPRLLTERPEVQLVFVGAGDDRGWLEDLAVAKRSKPPRAFPDRTDLLGNLRRATPRARFFALPSRGEGFGLVYLEAMACGKPVIGGLHGGAPEVIQDGVTGYLVPHGDPIQLATSLETLLADPVHAKEMGARAKQRVSTSFVSMSSLNH